MTSDCGDREEAKSGSLTTATISWIRDRPAPQHGARRAARLGRHASSRTTLLRDGERHSAKSKAVHDRVGEAVPARLTMRREMDKTFGLRAPLAQILRPGG